MESQSINEKYKTDYLFLLVGGNPLPNLVAARLLAKDDCQIFLLKTKQTSEIAKLLEEQIIAGEIRVHVTAREIDEANGRSIENKLKNEILNDISPEKSVGLNYTGGTKPMAVHSYRVFKERFQNCCFSYLDARTLKMFISYGDEPTQSPYVGDKVRLSLQDIVALHGYYLNNLRTQPQFSELYRPLTQVHSNIEGIKEWREWDRGWLRTRDLTVLPIREQYPNLKPVIEAFEKFNNSPTNIASYLGQQDINSCRKWFDGEWLEEYVLDELSKIIDEIGIHSYGIDLRPLRNSKKKKSSSDKEEGDFQLDLAAMRGYQLFAISCIASRRADGETKNHLFQAYVRARQLGGDEARVALVCCVENPKDVQKEVEKSWDANGKIRVFGRTDLLNLSKSLKGWFETANQESL